MTPMPPSKITRPSDQLSSQPSLMSRAISITTSPSSGSPQSPTQHRDPIALLSESIERHFAQINRRLDLLEAGLTNARLTRANAFQDSQKNLRPLRKSITGDGHARALHICSEDRLPNDVQPRNFNPSAAVGAVFPKFNPLIDSYTHIDVYKLVIFYNDDFGIVVSDDLTRRQKKIKRWLTVDMP